MASFTNMETSEACTRVAIIQCMKSIDLGKSEALVDVISHVCMCLYA